MFALRLGVCSLFFFAFHLVSYEAFDGLGYIARIVEPFNHVGFFLVVKAHDVLAQMPFDVLRRCLALSWSYHVLHLDKVRLVFIFLCRHFSSK